MSNSYIFNSLGTVAIFFVLEFALFGTFFYSTVSNESFRSQWYLVPASRVRGQPPGIVFGAVWLVIYTLVMTAIFMFYRTAELTFAYGSVIDTMTLLIAFNLACNLMWTPVFIGYRQPILGVFLILGILGTSAGLLYYFWVFNYIPSFGTFIFYPVWCLYALYLNINFIVQYNKLVKSGWNPDDNEPNFEEEMLRSISTQESGVGEEREQQQQAFVPQKKSGGGGASLLFNAAKASKNK